ncbi:MAG: molecular chaperone DnaJ [Gammaproteobacteria bacterium]|nr:MAG: molecular chaperone DnaJ [Gammaproteobacteria bacterium]
MHLIVLLALAVAAWALYKLYFQQLIAQGRVGKLKIALIVIGLLFLLLALTGRAPALFGFLGAAMTLVMRLAPLLVRYMPSLARLLGWRGLADDSDLAGGSSSRSHSGSGETAATMSEAEAREILGVSAEADHEEIIAAHRSLMARLHPDKGGNKWLASRLNAARERLTR